MSFPIKYVRHILLSPVSTCKVYLHNRRHRRFISLYDIHKNDVVLDVSCGDGHLLSVFRENLPEIELHGVDVQEDKISHAQRNYSWGQFRVASADNLSYDSERFNALLSCMSLHHYQNPTDVFKEAARVLKKGGKFYVVDVMPWCRLQQIFWNWDGCPEPCHFEKYYTLSELKKLISGSGLVLTGHHVLSLFSGERLVVLEKPNLPSMYSNRNVTLAEVMIHQDTAKAPMPDDKKNIVRAV